MNGSVSTPSSVTMNGTRFGHQSGDEVNVAAQAVELRHDDRCLRLAGAR
jgi:hypothetical protein